MRKGWAAAAFLILSLMSAAACADDPAPAAVVAAHPSDGDSDSIRLTPDTTKIVRLDEDAVSVIVANPNHANVVLDSPRLLVVMPRQPGTTLFTVLNAKGETILEKNVIIAGTVKPRYVRIRRSCGAADSGCAANSYYYCPDGCYEVTPVGEQGSMQAPPVVGGNGIGGNGEDGGDEGGGSSGAAAGAPIQQTAPPGETGSSPQIFKKETMPGVGIE